MIRRVAAVLMATLATIAVLTGCTPHRGSPRVLLIGDSLSVGARDSGGLGATDPASWTVNAVVGRGTNAGITAARSYDLRSFDVVVVALGTNDYLDDKTTYSARIANMMTVLGTKPVVWVNVDAGAARLHPAAFGVNPAIAAAPARHRTLRAADWSSYVGSRADLATLRASDGIHYTTAGYRVRARWMEALVAGY